uniref:Uncharacterized protein n=1 Tax=viral metagenome TaxID=1070528 RepID=A0A6M3IHW5_9ZZZZ
MKKRWWIIASFIVCLIPVAANAERFGLLFSEPDGSPNEAYAYKLIMPNGSVSVTAGGVATYTDGGTVTGDVTVSKSDPTLTLWNTDQENTNWGRRSDIVFKGEKTDGTVGQLGYWTFSHDGTGDDLKGKASLSLNDGNDADNALQVYMTITSAGVVTLGPAANPALYGITSTYEQKTGTSFTTDTGETYIHTVGTSIGNATSEGDYINIVGPNIFNTTTGVVSYNTATGTNIGNAAGATAVRQLNQITGYSIGNAVTGASLFYFNNVVGGPIANASTGGFYYNNIVGSGIFNTTTGTVAYNSATGSSIGNAAGATGSRSYNLMVGTPLANGSTSNVDRNIMVGTTHMNVTIGAITNNFVLGSSNMSGAGSTGARTYNFVLGTNIADDITGEIDNSFFFGENVFLNTTNETNLSRVIAIGEDAFSTSSAADMTNAIAIGYQAGLNNTMNSPALFGKSATATANLQAVVGSSYYTGGVLLDAQLQLNVESPAATAGSGVAAITKSVSFLVSDGGADNNEDTFSLADGTVAGQIKIIVYKTNTDGADSVNVTPAHGSFTDILFGTAGEGATLIFDGTNWQIVSNNGGVIS